MESFFEHLGHDEDQQRVANRKAVAVARKRADDRFGDFVRAARDEEEFKARLALVEDDLDAALTDVVDEHGGDLERVKSAVQSGWEDLVRGGDGRWQAPSAAPDDGTDIDTELSEAPSAVGESSGDLISAPESIQSVASTTRWSIGIPNPLDAVKNLPGEVAQGVGNAVTDVPGNLADGVHGLEQGSQALDHATQQVPGVGNALHEVNITPGGQGLHHLEQGLEGLQQLPGQPPLNNLPGGNPQFQKMLGHQAAEAPDGAGGAVDRESLPKGDESALGGPSPKIDKGNSGDERGWSLKPVETETSGTPHPTVEQDVTDDADYGKRDFLDQTDAVIKSEDLPSDDDSAGFTTERNVEQPSQAADQWTGTEGQADPVTNESDQVLARTAYDDSPGERDHDDYENESGEECSDCGKAASKVGSDGVARCDSCASSANKSAAVDPEKNPIREVLESDYDGFLPESQVEAAIQQHKGESNE